MKSRAFLSSVLAVVCLAAIWAVFAQRQRLAELRVEHQRLVAESEKLSPPESAEKPPAAPDGPPGELLRLRSEVARLMARQRELSGAGRENEQLRAQLAARTNAPPALPPDYILRSKAQWAGLATPENTLQSFLWALERRDFTNFLQVLTPETVQDLQKEAQRSEEFMQQFTKAADLLPGVRVLSRQQRPDGDIELLVEFIPGMPPSGPIRFRQFGGEWKMGLFGL